jgi:hypothetical protein
MCERKSTSREHVPPKCFFPKSKDSLSSKDLRINLITVPSCDDHNNKKSGDDLYLLHIIAMAYKNNQEGLNLFKNRIRKTAESHPHLLKSFFADFEKAFAKNQVSLAIEIEMKRFETGMTWIAHAIYFHHFKTKWQESIEIKSPSLRYLSETPNYIDRNTALADAEKYDAGAQKYGKNQDIFFYQFIDGSHPDHKLVRMVFYQGFVVLAIPLTRIGFIRQNSS